MSREIKFEYGFTNHAPEVFTMDEIQAGQLFMQDGFGSVKYRRQWTGLKDKNEKPIYEGDLIRWDDASGGQYWRVAEVIWSEIGCWTFRTIPHLCVNCLKSEPRDFNMGSFIYTPNTGSGGNVLEVIGNIHEHSHLLEQGNEPKE